MYDVSNFEPLKRVKIAKTPTHSVSLSVMTSTPEEHREVFAFFNIMLSMLDKTHNNVSMQSVDLAEVDDEEPLPEIIVEDLPLPMDIRDALFNSLMKDESYSEYPKKLVWDRFVKWMNSRPQVTYNADTLDKVRDGLKAAGIADDLIEQCIIQIQNQGVLFRERTP